jgi:hypothetical protein
MTGALNSPRFLATVTATVAVLATTAGCGNSKGLVPVEGRVTFAGKEPAGPGYLYFVPRELSTNLRQDRAGPLPGTALFLADGRYRAGTFTPGDGLRPGTYEVRIVCAMKSTSPVDPATVHNTVESDLVPTGFTPPDLTVPHSGVRPVVYDLDVN